MGLALMVVAIVSMTYALIEELLVFKKLNRPLLVISKRGLSFYVWIFILIIWTVNFIKFYDNERLIMYLLWFEVSGLNILRSFRGSAIYESGIYIRGTFYKWGHIRDYSWEFHNELQLQLKYFKVRVYIKDELKTDVEEILQTYVVNYQNN